MQICNLSMHLCIIAAILHLISFGLHTLYLMPCLCFFRITLA